MLTYMDLNKTRTNFSLCESDSASLFRGLFPRLPKRVVHASGGPRHTFTTTICRGGDTHAVLPAVFTFQSFVFSLLLSRLIIQSEDIWRTALDLLMLVDFVFHDDVLILGRVRVHILIITLREGLLSRVNNHHALLLLFRRILLRLRLLNLFTLELRLRIPLGV